MPWLITAVHVGLPLVALPVLARICERIEARVPRHRWLIGFPIGVGVALVFFLWASLARTIFFGTIEFCLRHEAARLCLTGLFGIAGGIAAWFGLRYCAERFVPPNILTATTEEGHEAMRRGLCQILVILLVMGVVLGIAAGDTILDILSAVLAS